ncbi:MAG: proton-conducting transporter membrane subunit [Gemmatimonadota bacterium]|nr:proton-conducting transporter membrane subunit [Gemmatimonadota bacterium]
MNGPPLELPWLVLGGTLTFDGVALVFLASTALAWTSAGWAALLYMRNDPQRGRFMAFFALAMASSLLAAIAGDPITFFLAYSVLGLAAYPLVAHRRTNRAVRTARWYLVFMLGGEGALLAAILLAADTSGASTFPVAIASVGVSILVALGLGVKCGVPGLHVWMPATYAAAPWPAAVALAGGTVGVGVLGFLRFGLVTPSSAVSHDVWIVLGATGAVLGVVRGLVRREPERILAYSSVSQMGVALAVLGFGAAGGADTTSLALAVAAFVAHHALAKASLFMGVGAVRGGTALGGRRDHPVLIAMVAIPALALAGAPLTSGALAKSAITSAVGSPELDCFLLVSSAATAALMLHFLASLVRMSRAGDAARSLGGSVMAPWWLSVMAVALGAWVWPAFRSMAADALRPSVIMNGVPPLAIGALMWAALALGGWKGTRRVSIVDRTAGRVGSGLSGWIESRREVRPDLSHLSAGTRRKARYLTARGVAAVATLDRRVGTWTLTGSLLLGLVLALRVLL